MNVYEKLVDILVAVLLMLLLPLLYVVKRTEVLTQLELQGEVQNFMEDVKTHGYLTKELYEVFLERVSAFHPLVTVELLHEKLVFKPVYETRMGTGSPVFTGEIMQYQVCVYTKDIIEQMVQNPGGYQFETNSSFQVILRHTTGGDHQAGNVITLCKGRIRDSMELK